MPTLMEALDTLGQDVKIEERWVPIDSLGERWHGRTKERAEDDLRRYGQGAPDAFDGVYVVRIEREVRLSSDWMVVDE